MCRMRLLQQPRHREKCSDDAACVDAGSTDLCSSQRVAAYIWCAARNVVVGRPHNDERFILLYQARPGGNVDCSNSKRAKQYDVHTQLAAGKIFYACVHYASVAVALCGQFVNMLRCCSKCKLLRVCVTFAFVCMRSGSLQCDWTHTDRECTYCWMNFIRYSLVSDYLSHTIAITWKPRSHHLNHRLRRISHKHFLNSSHVGVNAT